jgi:hypothetical protein
MAPWNKMLHSGVLGALFLAAFSTSALGQGPGVGGGGIGTGAGVPTVGSQTPGTTQLSGRVLCINCSLEEMQAKQPQDDKTLYELSRDQERAVLQLETVNNARRWDEVNLTQRLQVRGADDLWQKLTAAENLNKQVALAGILSSTRTLDLSSVTFTEDASHPEEGAPARGDRVGPGR